MDLDLSTLRAGMPGLTSAWGASLEEAAAACLVHCGHSSGIALSVRGSLTATYALSWQVSAPADVHARAWADMQDSTEFGACGIAIAVLNKHENLVVVQRAAKGGGFDYFLGAKDWSGNLFQGTSRLEVSGSLQGGDRAVTQRTRQKQSQLQRSASSGLSGYVAIVEFSAPVAEVTKK